VAERDEEWRDMQQLELASIDGVRLDAAVHPVAGVGRRGAVIQARDQCEHDRGRDVRSSR
jgi:hypothetical protein